MQLPRPTLFEQILGDTIRFAVERSNGVSGVTNAGLRGLIRESLVENLFEPLLPSPYRVGTGIIVDHEGAQSNQSDIIVWNNAIHPPLFTARGAGIYAVESVLATVEIKSTLAAKDYEQTFVNAIKLATMSYIGKANVPDRAIPPVNLIFAFNSRTKATADELTRMRTIGARVIAAHQPILRARGTPEAPENFVQGLVIPGRRCYAWALDDHGNLGWQTHEPSRGSQYREVRMVVASLLNSLGAISRDRGQPRIGHYVVRE